MIHVFAHKIAVSIKAAAPNHPASIEVLAFPIAAILNATFIIGLSLAVAAFTGKIDETLIALFFFAILRQVSGGVHLKDGTICILVSAAGITALSFADFDAFVSLVVTGLSLLLVIIFAPSRIEKQTRIPKKYYPLLKVLAIMIVCSNFLFVSPVLATTFLVQSLTLIRGRR